jgi:5-methylcytosine-specific restriction endonuclease McrA
MPKTRESRDAGDVKLRLTYDELGQRLRLSKGAAKGLADRRNWVRLVPDPHAKHIPGSSRGGGNFTIVVVPEAELLIEVQRRPETGRRTRERGGPLREVPCADGCGKLVHGNRTDRCCEACRTLRRRQTKTEWREANLDSHRAYNRSYANTNRERASLLRVERRAKNPDMDKATRQEWYRHHKERWKVYEATRSARERGAPGSFTCEDVTAILTHQQSRCFYCGRGISNDRHTIDHYIPLARGGSNWPENIVAACRPCNTGKGATLPDEYIKRRIKRGQPVADSWLLGHGRLPLYQTIHPRRRRAA